MEFKHDTKRRKVSDDSYVSITTRSDTQGYTMRKLSLPVVTKTVTQVPATKVSVIENMVSNHRDLFPRIGV